MSGTSPAGDRSVKGVYPPDPYQRPDRDGEVVLPATSVGERAEVVRLPSNRKFRRTVILAVWGFTCGALLLVFQVPGRNEMIAPGPLTGHHAQILAGLGGDRCAACHSAGNGNWLGWTRSVLGDNSACPTSQSELCLNCHQQTIDPVVAANPHSLGLDQLRLLTRQQEAPFRTAGMELPADHEYRQLACAACHREHRGREIDLTAMSDQQCQTCHAQRHRNFEDGHPEFELVGSQLPSAIRFDHQLHLRKYFPESQSEFTCTVCHMGDSQRNVMQLGSFESMCSSCHSQTIRTTGQQGLVLLELPLLDLDRLTAAGHEIGSWPEGARGDFAGRLHPLTWSLLAKDPELAAALKTFPAGFDFSDIDPGDREQLHRVAELASGLKRLLLELAAGDFRELARGQPGARPGANSTAAAAQVFRDAVAQWFPEMASQGKFAGDPADDSGPGPGESQPVWVPDSAILARWLQDQELLAPNPLTGKVAPAATGRGAAGEQAETSKPATQSQTPAEAGPSPQVISRPLITKSPAPVDGINRREESSKPAPLRANQAGLPAASPESNSELLAANPLQGKFPGGSSSSEADRAVPNQTPTRQTDSINNLDQQRNEHAPPHKAAVNQSSQAPAIEPVFSRPVTNQIPQPVTLCGWTRDDAGFRLVYHVSGHEDPFWPELQRWLVTLQESGQSDAAMALRQSLHDPAAPGVCFACHRIGDQTEPSAESIARGQISWKSELRNPNLKGFTRFSHAPHLLQLQCTGCHQLAEPPAAAPQTQLAKWRETGPIRENSTGEGSDFAPLGRSTCLQCHQANQASQACTTCHHYHVDRNWLKSLEGVRRQ